MRSSWITLIASATPLLASSLPTVDLGYAIQQATINVSFCDFLVEGEVRGGRRGHLHSEMTLQRFQYLFGGNHLC